MNLKNPGIPASLLFVFVTSLLLTSCNTDKPEELPNILWLTSEDNSTFLGCYGDEFATSPNLDQLASEGFLYTHAYANAPVCAPARNTILTGVYACSNGNHNMRSRYALSEIVRTYPEYLREIGYYCTNNSKTDYNTNSVDPAEIWDESGKEAHYRNRPPDKPFFAVFNTTITHESSIFKPIPYEELRHDPEQVPLPPYHPETAEMKHDWAQYYDKIEDMDAWIGEKLKELEDEGLAENTIVIYYADHGGVLARSKRYVYETGTHVPLIIRIPEKYRYLYPGAKPGSKVDRLVSFVDLVPTLLSIAEIPVPEYLQGNAFLGKQKTEDPPYAYMFRGRMDERYDMSRAVRDGKYRYIRNYTPYRVYGQHLEYLWKAASIRSWEKAWLSGECNELQSVFWNDKPPEELYDTENDPWETRNLAGDPAHREVLERMRKACRDWVLGIRDAGFIPEADMIDRVGDVAMYDYMRSGRVSPEELVDAAEMATMGDMGNLDKLIELLKSDESALRYWGATGLLILGEDAETAMNVLKKAAHDRSANVANVAAEALYNLGERELAVEALLSSLEDQNEFARLHALNVIDAIGTEDPAVKEGIRKMLEREWDRKPSNYTGRMADWLFTKWSPDTGRP